MAAKRKFSSEEIKLLRSAYSERERLLKEAEELKIKNLAAKWEVSFSTMWDILNYKTYRNVL